MRDPTTEYLFNDWYDFDDSRVTKFNVNKMHKYFGNSKESAFILVYRKTSLHTGSATPKELVPPSTVLSQVLKEEKDLKQNLQNYELFKRKLRIHVAEADMVYNFDTCQILSGASKDLIVDFGEPLMGVRQRIKAELGLSHDDWCLVEYEGNEPDPALLVRLLTEDGPHQPVPHTVESLKVHHDSYFFVIAYDHPQYKSLGQKLTLGKVYLGVTGRC